MNSNWKLCPLLIVVLASCVHEGMSIKCWVCRSDVNPVCDDPFDNSTMALVDCNRLEPELPVLTGIRSTMCKKTRQRVNEEWRIIRGCAFVSEPGVDRNETSCDQPLRTERTFVEYCTCNSRDGCNT